ncbi:MAG: GAF domain-containing protein [Cyanobacteria bacterium P01_A01_bin.135]
MTQPPYTVLLVDDSPEDRELYRRYLKRDTEHTYELIEASLGVEGLVLWQQHQPDAVLLDYRLPDLDGLEFLAQMQSQLPAVEREAGDSPEPPDFPVVMVTGQGNEAIAVQAMKAGAQDYLVKERMTPEALHLAITGAISRVQLRQQLQQRIERERLVSEITRRVHQTLDLDEVLQTAVDEVRQFLQTDRVLLFRLYENGQGDVVTESVGAQWASLLAGSFHDPCLKTEHVDYFRQGRVALRPDIHNGSVDQCHVRLLERLQVQANLVVPILQSGHLWGMLIAHNCRQPRRWQPLEVELLEDIAAQVGIALQQAELYQKAQRELAERRRVEAELRESEERLRLAQRAAGAGLWDWDLTTNQITWSDEYYRLYGLDDSVVPSYESWLAPVLAPDRDRVNQAILNALEQDSGLNVEFRILHPIGGLRWLTLIGQTLHDGDGHPSRMTGISLNITKRKQAEEALATRARELTRLNGRLKIMTADLDQRNQDLNQFAYIVSHDLKAPLRGIQNLSQWLQEDLGNSLPPDNQHQLKLLSNRASTMEALINDLLQYSRAGRVKQPPELVNLGELLADVVSTLTIPPGVAIRLTSSLSTVWVRRVMLAQVLANLLSNAIKYGCVDGQGDITVSACEQENGYRFAIADKGPGIAPEDRERIFGIFETLANAAQKNSALEAGVVSTGIGLAIVKRLVGAEGGRIWVESEMGSGSSFIFTWQRTNGTALSSQRSAAATGIGYTKNQKSDCA